MFINDKSTKICRESTPHRAFWLSNSFWLEISKQKSCAFKVSYKFPTWNVYIYCYFRCWYQQLKVTKTKHLDYCWLNCIAETNTQCIYIHNVCVLNNLPFLSPSHFILHCWEIASNGIGNLGYAYETFINCILSYSRMQNGKFHTRTRTHNAPTQSFHNNS